MQSLFAIYFLFTWLNTFSRIHTFRFHTFKKRMIPTTKALKMMREDFPQCFYQEWGINPNANKQQKPEKPIPATTVDELKRLISEGYRVQDIEVLGNTTNKYKHYTELFSSSSSSGYQQQQQQDNLVSNNNTTTATTSSTLSTTTNSFDLLNNNSRIHPVIRALYERSQNNNKSSSSASSLSSSNERGDRDGRKIALAIEGGGMRGCVAAGMVTVSTLIFTMDATKSKIYLILLCYIHTMICL